MRIVITPISGALTSGPKNDESEERDHDRRHAGSSIASAKTGRVSATKAVAPSRIGSYRRDEPHRHEAPEHGAGAEGREEDAGDAGAAEYSS